MSANPAVSLTADLADVSTAAPTAGQVLVAAGFPLRWTPTAQAALVVGALSTAFTSGRVLVGQGTGIPTTDGLTLCLDTTNHRVGVGTDIPVATLDVRSVSSPSGAVLLVGFGAAEDVYIRGGSNTATIFIGDILTQRIRLFPAATGCVSITSTATPTAGINKLIVLGSSADAAANVQFNARTVNEKPFVVAGLDGQAANLQEWQDYLGGIASTVSENGYLTTRKTSAPADAELAVGELAWWFTPTPSGAKANFKGKDSAGTVVSGSLNLT